MSYFLQAAHSRNRNNPAPAGPRPTRSQQKVVRSLSSIIPPQTQNLNEADYPDHREVWVCPFGIKCHLVARPVQERMWCAPNTGFTNLYNHLISCCDGGEVALIRMYEEALERASEAGVEPNRNGNILQYFVPSSVSVKAQQLYGWLKWITEKTCL
jgi:hypothetical protein